MGRWIKRFLIDAGEAVSGKLIIIIGVGNIIMWFVFFVNTEPTQHSLKHSLILIVVTLILTAINYGLSRLRDYCIKHPYNWRKTL